MHLHPHQLKVWRVHALEPQIGLRVNRSELKNMLLHLHLQKYFINIAQIFHKYCTNIEQNLQEYWYKLRGM